MLPPPHSARALALAVLAAASAHLLALAAPVAVSISSGSPPVHRVAPEYVSFNLDWHFDDEEWPAWRGASVMNMSLTEPNLAFLTAALAPAHLRVGGSEGDLVVYVLPGYPCAIPAEQNSTANPVPFCLNATRWAQIHIFAAQAGVTLAFGLNAMAGRRSASARMNTSNLAAFIAATAAAGYDASNTLPWLEFVRARAAAAVAVLPPARRRPPPPQPPRSLRPAPPSFSPQGNELEYKADAAPYAADLREVSALIAAAWPDAAKRPRIVANDENPDPSYWEAMLPLVGSAVSAASWHEYVGYGLDPELPSKALNFSFLDGIKGTAAAQVAAAAKARFAGELWVGETALAWHSGRDNTTNAFASTFWYLHQLGSYAATHTVQCRQALLGGNYELIDKMTRQPNPDFWLALLFKRTMGTGVLTATADAGAAPQLRVYAHCAAGAPAGRGVTLAFANLSPDTPVTLTVSGGGGAPLTAPRSEWHLTAPGGDMTSRTVLLNGAPLLYGGPGRLDPAAPRVVVDPAAPLVIAPRSNGFVTWPDAPNMC